MQNWLPFGYNMFDGGMNLTPYGKLYPWKNQLPKVEHKKKKK